MLPNSITIFTDGSSRGNPGPGGFGAIVIAPKNQESRIPRPTASAGLGTNQEVTELGGREEYTTNNRMELRAVIEALSFASTLNHQPYTLLVYSDSSYVINGITKWVFGWQKNGWKTATKKEVENQDLWENLLELTRDKQIEWKQVGGHVGVAGNERCDEIATQFADGEKPKLYNGPLSEYPIKNILNLYDTRPYEAVPGTFGRVSYKKLEAKNSSRAHQKAKAFSYVSLVDGKIMVHKTWAECEARVKGKRAKYKKALNPQNEADIIASFTNQ